MTKLPCLKDLRAEAELLGVDISSMGRSKIKILKALEIARKNASEQEASKLPEGSIPRKMIKIAPSFQPPILINPTKDLKDLEN